MNRGLSLVELLLALTISSLVAAGVAAMLGGVATGIAVGTDARTGMLASGVIQGRFVEAISPGACILGAEEHRAALWLGDMTPGGQVEPSECAWMIYDPDLGLLSIERVVFPDDWSPIQRAKFDRPLRPNTDPFPLLEEAREAGIVEREILADSIADAQFGIEGSPLEQSQVRLDLWLDLPTSEWPMSAIAVFMAYDVPLEWTP